MIDSSFGFLAVATLHSAIIAGTPLLMAATGEIFCEKSGIYNIGLEGIMLVGAFTGIFTAVSTGSIFLAIFAAGLAGLIMALVHAFFTVSLQANQIVCGFALVILGTGLSSFLGIPYVGRKSVHASKHAVLFISDIPVAGDIFFNHDYMVYFSYLLVFTAWFILFKTKWGIAVRAAGEDPNAAQLMGINVQKTRYICVLISGLLTGMAGAYLSVIHTEMWVEHMTAGRGWIAVALVIFAGWNPVKALIGAYLFGMMISLQFRLQTLGIDISAHLMSMLPYVITIIALLVSCRAKKGLNTMPTALGKPFKPQS